MKITIDPGRSLGRGQSSGRAPEDHAVVECALRREIRCAAELENTDSEKFEMGPLGFLVLKRRPGETISLEQIRTIQDELDEEEVRRSIDPRE